MAEKINRIVIEKGGKEYEFTGGGQADSVGSEEIRDHSITRDDLAPDVIAGLEELDNVEVLSPEDARGKVADIIAQAEADH